MGKTVLVTDDDVNVQEILRLYLEKEGYDVITAGDGRQALEALERQNPDLIILDVMMPHMDGWEVCREVRKKASIPIIMLSAKGEDYDRILGLELGADDYVVKPFNPGEVVARVKAVFRRIGDDEPQAETGVIRIGSLEVDPLRRESSVHGQTVALTPKEFDLLHFLVTHPERAFDREQLLNQVWGYDYLGDSRTVDAHVKRLRKKIETQEDDWSIATVWGFGYKFTTGRK